MSANIHKDMLQNAQQDEAFRARSQSAAKNRRGGDSSRPVQPSHCQGSVSTAERAKRLAAQKGGVLPTAAELYLDTHMKDVKGKGKVPISEKARQIKETYEKNLAERQQSDESVNPNQVLYETVGGRKKGKVPGLGSSADMYYDKSSWRSGSTRSTGSSPTMLSQLSQRLDQVEGDRLAFERDRITLERERLELERQRLAMESRFAPERERFAAETQKKDEQIARLMSTMEQYSQMFSQCKDYFPFTPPGDPRDPPSAGGSGACAT